MRTRFTSLAGVFGSEAMAVWGTEGREFRQFEESFKAVSVLRMSTLADTRSFVCETSPCALGSVGLRAPSRLVQAVAVSDADQVDALSLRTIAEQLPPPPPSR